MKRPIILGEIILQNIYKIMNQVYRIYTKFLKLNIKKINTSSEQVSHETYTDGKEAYKVYLKSLSLETVERYSTPIKMGKIQGTTFKLLMRI